MYRAMRMKQKALLFYLVSLVAFFAALAAVVAVYGERSTSVLVLALAWVGIVGVLQFLWLRCPHCHRFAIHKPSGGATPFVGDRCRYCGESY